MAEKILPTAVSANKLKVIGLYGLSGVGKTRLLGQLPAILGSSRFSYFEGSEIIDSIVPGGLDGFKKAKEVQKYAFRTKAIHHIRDECLSASKVGIVTGHVMFWEDEDETQPPGTALTDDDLKIYTNIIYLKADPNVIAQRRRNECRRRVRRMLSVDHLEKWQDAEIKLLTDLCRQHKILFIVISADLTPLANTVKLVEDFYQHDETVNLKCAKQALDETVQTCSEAASAVETMLVVDADKTLSVDDASAMFWREAGWSSCPLGAVFDSPLQFSYEAFRQVTLLLEEAADEQTFEEVCERTAAKVQPIYEEMRVLLQHAVTTEHTSAVVVTCGVRRVWELVLKKHGLDKIKVIGGGRIGDGYVVSADVKAELVSHLRTTYNMYVCAIGDSPLDLGMLKAANLAIVAVGPKDTRSQSMESKLQEAIVVGGLEAKQVLLPDELTSPKRECNPLPVMKLDDTHFLADIFNCRRVPVLTPEDNNGALVKLLMTPTRNADVSGPELRAAHRRIGYFLTIHCVSQILGVEKFEIPHVQGHMTDGYRITGEKSTTIIALMRAGEPMASGVSEAMPTAMFVHAHTLDDVKDHDLEGQSTIVIVDSVINTGKSIVEFVVGLRKKSKARIVVIAGVVQQEAVRDVGSKRAYLSRALSQYQLKSGISVVALRVSENKYKGTGTTDTGNRLFNTPHLL